MKKTALLVTCLVLISGYGYSATRRVPDQYATIQEAIDVASYGDTVLISSGIYYPNFETGYVANFENKEGITLIGIGSTSSITFEGNASTGDYGIVHYYNSYDCIIEGITLTNSSATRLIVLRGSSSGISITGCNFIDSGYAIFIDDYSSGSVSNNTFQNIFRGIVFSSRSTNTTEIFNNEFIGTNTASISISGYENSIANIHHNMISNSYIGIEGDWGIGTVINYNTIYNNGYGIRGYGSSILFNIIRNNEYGIWILGEQPTISNNTVVENSNIGIYIGGYSFSILTKNIIAQNGGAGISVDMGGNPTISCNDVWSNSNFANGNYVGFITDQTGYNGNISVDPLFCNPSSDDYSIASNSLALMQTCGAMGAITVAGCSPIMAASEKSWGAIKSLYNE